MYSKAHHLKENGSAAVDETPKCNFPTTPRQSSAVKSLLEISESMDITFLRSKLESSKQVNNFGPWLYDDRWLPRKQRSERNNRKQAARLLLSKRAPTSNICSKTTRVALDEKYENTNCYSNININHHVSGETSHEAMDPYFKKRPSTVSGQYFPSTVSSATTKEVEVFESIQTPSLPTLITLQSPNNKDFHSAFSLGKVDYTETERAMATYLPYCSNSNNYSRKTKSAVSAGHKMDDVIQSTINNSKEHSTKPPGPHSEENNNESVDNTANEAYTMKLTSITSTPNRGNQGSDTVLTKTSNTNNNNSTSIFYSKRRYNNNNNNTNNNIITLASNRYPDRFDNITSPPENPKILKILAQRKPAPPVCEFEDISVHIRHYRMYHTVRFTGQFSLANHQITQEVRPVQWNEVFPHRPLSVSTTSVPVFRFKAEDFSSQTKTNQMVEDGSLAPFGDVTKDATTGNDMNEKEDANLKTQDIGQGQTSYSRRATPNFKDKDTKIDLSPTVTPVLKIDYKRIKNNRSHDGSAEEKAEEENTKEETKSKRHYKVKKAKSNQSAEDFDQNAKNVDLFKVRRNSSGPLTPSSKARRESANNLYNFEKNEEDNNTTMFDEGPGTQEEIKHEDFVKSQSPCDTGGSLNDQTREEEERDTERVLFSYREFLKRSVSNASRGGMYSPRFRYTREPPATPADWKRPGERDWIYPRKHGVITILGSENELATQNWRNIIIDEKQLRTSIDEKITGSHIMCTKPSPKRPAEIGDRFVKFMIKQEQCQKNDKAKIQNKGRSDQSRQRRQTINACDDDSSGVGEGHLKINGETKSFGVVSAYDCKNGFDSDGEEIIEAAGGEALDEEYRNPNESATVSTPRRNYWCPKLSRLSARTRADNHKLDNRRELISSAFRYKPVSQNSSALVIAVPPPNVGFDDRGLVLPLQDFMHLTMKGNDKTFSKFSKSINNSSKVGLSPNMTIRSGSGRRSMDDGIVRVVSFASPVNQFIFAKRITGYSAQGRGMAVSDGTFVDAEDKGRSLFQRKGPGSFRLRLRDVDIQRPIVAGDLQESNLGEQNGPTSKDELLPLKDDHEGAKVGEVKSDGGEEQSTEESELKICIEKKYYDIYIPRQGKAQTDDSENDNGNEISSDRREPSITMKDGNNEANETNIKVSRSKQVGEEIEERARSALRQHIVKLAEFRTSSKTSDYEITDEFRDEGTKPPYSPNRNILGTPGITMSYDLDIFPDSTEANNNSLLSKSFTQGEFDNIKTSPNHSDNTDIGNKSGSHARDNISFRQKCQSRQKYKTLPRNRLSKTDAIIHKDVQENMPNSETTESLKPEGNPLMYSKVVRESCLKKDVVTDLPERPKTVRFKCDGVEYKMLERSSDKKL